MAILELEAIGIVKRYGAVLANDHVDLSVERGEIHAVMGENGAGKSTLMSILYGLQRPDEGRILLRGAEVRFRSALDAIAAGHGHGSPGVQAVQFAHRLGEHRLSAPSRGAAVFIDRRAARRECRRTRRAPSSSASIPTPLSARCRSACASASKS